MSERMYRQESPAHRAEAETRKANMPYPILHKLDSEFAAM
jgi:hypothetical protein